MVLVSGLPKIKHKFSLTTDFKVTASHDQISSASHLIGNADACAFSHLQKRFIFSNSTNKFLRILVSLLALKNIYISENPQFRFSLLEIFPFKLDFCLTQVALIWLHAFDCCGGIFDISQGQNQPWTLILCAGHCYSNIISTKMGGKGNKENFHEDTRGDQYACTTLKQVMPHI